MLLMFMVLGLLWHVGREMQSDDMEELAQQVKARRRPKTNQKYAANQRIFEVSSDAHHNPGCSQQAWYVGCLVVLRSSHSDFVVDGNT